MLREFRNAFGLVIILALAGPSLTLADEALFYEPPQPEALAELLYGPRYRIAQPAAENEAPGRFGMMIHFEYNSTKIVPKSLPLLDTVGQMLGLDDVAKRVLVIEGHADASGSDAYNLTLSERRAEAIKAYLVGSFDIEPKRLLSVGAGEHDLYNTDDPYHASNRRVVFRSIRSVVID